MKKLMLTMIVAITLSHSSANAGCLKGAAIGGMAGHLLGRHAIIGAVGGCMVGQHMDKEKMKRYKNEKHSRDQNKEKHNTNTPYREIKD
jgi:outer membrane lipoprotein SlyB